MHWTNRDFPPHRSQSRSNNRNNNKNRNVTINPSAMTSTTAPLRSDSHSNPHNASLNPDASSFHPNKVLTNSEAKSDRKEFSFLVDMVETLKKDMLDLKTKIGSPHSSQQTQYAPPTWPWTVPRPTAIPPQQMPSHHPVPNMIQFQQPPSSF